MYMHLGPTVATICALGGLGTGGSPKARPLLKRLLLALRSACAAPGAAQTLLRLLEAVQLEKKEQWSRVG